ncbi:MAG: choice-of-anchor D domain-containing protein [Myxococcota bacterium]
MRGVASGDGGAGRAAVALVALAAAGCIEHGFVAEPGAPAGAAPDIVVTPDQVAFGLVTLPHQGYASVLVQNVGDAELTLELPVVTSADVAVGPAPSSLAPGAEAAIDLAWTPNQPLAAALRLGSDDPDEPMVEVPLTGAVSGPDLVVTPPTVSFGEHALGEVASATFRVENVGQGPLVVSDVTWTAVDGDLTATSIGGLPGTLAPGASTDLVVQYEPHAYGVDAGSFTIASDDPDSPSVVVTADGSSIDPCDGFTRHVELSLTADDAWEGWLDGASFTAPGAGNWGAIDTVAWDLSCGPHVLALYATDQALAVSGVLASVKVDGVTTFVSGVDHWSITDVAPPADWTDLWFDDAAWRAPVPCSDSSLWGAAPDPLYAEGAAWIWWTDACTSLGQAWLRLEFTVEP